MSNKFKPWQQRQPKKHRSENAKEMFLASKGGPMRDRRKRRAGEQEDSGFWDRDNRYNLDFNDEDN